MPLGGIAGVRWAVYVGYDLGMKGAAFAEQAPAPASEEEAY